MKAEAGFNLEFEEGVVIAGVNMPKLVLYKSKFQSAVYSAAREFLKGDLLEEEYVVAGPGTFDFLTMDVACVERKVGVEADGPGHYIVDLGTGVGGESYRRRVNGSTRLKDRLLRKCGWKVAHVAYWEWEEGREQEVMMRALKEAKA